jgi:hypothetical protein
MKVTPQLGSTTNTSPSISNPAFQIEEMQHKLCIGIARGETTHTFPSGHVDATSLKEEDVHALTTNWNWPLPNIGEPNIVHEAPATFTIPGKPKPIIFKSSRAPIHASDILPREKMTVENFQRYSPASRRMMKQMGFNTNDPGSSGYGPEIPIPPGTDKGNSFRSPQCKLGLGAQIMDDDEGHCTSLCVSTQGNMVDSNQPASSPESTTPSDSQTQPVEDLECDKAPQSIEDGGQPTIDELEEINLGTADEPRPTFIAKALPVEAKEALIKLLHEFKDVFAWNYTEMPGLDPKIAMHHLNISPDKKPVKQAPRRFRPELEQQIEGEVNKLLTAGFIREVKYPRWISNIVPVKKKNGQIRVCVDFRDLNAACP